MYVCHAEVNAILNKNSTDTKGCDIYVALFPCNGCAKMIIQSQIKKIIYFSDKYADRPKTVASKKLLDAAGVKYVKFTSSTLTGQIDLNFLDVNRIGELNLNEENIVQPKHLNWTDYFMSIAVLASYRCRVADGNGTGACIINSGNRIVGKMSFRTSKNFANVSVILSFLFFHSGIGYYGLPGGCEYDDFPYLTATDRDLYFCHAESNAITNKNCESVANCTIYVTHFPCCECAKILIQSGIKKIFFLNDESFDSADSKAACRMFDAVNIEYVKYEMAKSKIVIDFDAINR